MYNQSLSGTAKSLAPPLADQYALNLGALTKLGFEQREIEEDVPALESIEDAFQPEEREWVNQQTAAGYAAKLVIAPSVQSIGLVGMRYAPGLLTRFDMEQPKRADTKVSKAWLRIGDVHPVHDNGFSNKFSAAILLEPKGDLIDCDDEGAYTDGSLRDDQLLRSIASANTKMRALQRDHSEQSDAGRRVVSATVSQLVVQEAMARHTGQRSFHHRYSSCLPHYPLMPGGRSGSLPTFALGGRRNRQLILDARMLFVADETVIRAMDIQPEPEANTALTV